MANVGKAYVTIIPKAEGISEQISSIITPAADGAGRVGGSSLASGLSRGIESVGSVVTKFAASSAATISGIAGAISSKAMGGGLSRAMQIDDARAKMTQLGMDTEKVMSNVNDSVSGTRYGLNEMAGVAVNLTSSGVKAGKGLTNSLKSVASAASISGVDLNHMGAIYTKVASAGKVTGQVMQQLQENGINANAALQKSLGKSQEEISKMVSKGEIDFKTFSDAMYNYFGDASLSANSTFSGAMANVQAALSRIGAKFADPALGKLREIFAGTNAEVKGGLMLALDNLGTALQPVIDKFSEFVNVVGDRVISAIDTFNNVMANGGSALDGFKAAIADLIPDSLQQKFSELDPSMQSLLGGLGKVAGIIGGVAGGMGLLSGAVGSLIPGIGGLLGPLGGAGGAFSLVSKAGSTLFGTISQLIGGGGLGGLSGPLSALTGPLGIAAAAFGAMFIKSESFRNAIMGLVKTIISSLMPVIKSLIPPIQQAIGIVMQVAQILGDTLAPIIQQLTPIIGKLISSVGSLISTLAGALLPAIKAILPAVESILSIVGPIVSTIASVVIEAVTGIINTITPIIKKILAVVVPVLTKIAQVVSTVLGKVKSVFSTVWNAVVPIVKGAVNKIKSIIEGIKSVVSKVTSVFGKIKDAMTKPVEKVRDTIKKIIEKIKGFFKFTPDTPKIKLPHFGIKPEGWKMKDLLKGKIPKLSIRWAAKGGIMDSPTLVGAGEAGQEALLPLDPFWRKLDEFKESINGGDTYNTYLQYDAGDDANDMLIDLARGIKRFKRAGAF